MRRLFVPVSLVLLAAADWPGEASDAPWRSTDLGVEVQDLQVGTGTEVTDRAGVEVHYTGMLEDGAVFDSSRDRDRTFSFRVGGGEVIRGWEDGLLGMRVGGKRRLVIPPSLGYGDRAAGPIPPGSTLYFEIELLGVTEPRRAPEAPSPVDADAWRTSGDLRVADLVVGDGKKLKVKAGRRACVDYALFGPDGAVVEHTWHRAGCTWYSLADDDLPAGIEAGVAGMREGGRRAIEAADGQRYEVVYYSRDQ